MKRIGDKVKIVANLNAHKFEIGHVGEITEIKQYPSGLIGYEIDYNWWVEDAETVRLVPDKTDENVSV